MSKSDDLSSRNTNEDGQRAEEIDLYSDVLTDHDEIIQKLKQKVEDLIQQKNLLTKNLNSLQQRYELLQKDYKNLQSKYKIVSYNSSALFKTAQAELARKNRTIQEVRKECDDLIFRKAPTRKSGRHRIRDYSPKKTSPKRGDTSETDLLHQDDNPSLKELKDPQLVLEEKSVEQNKTKAKESSKSCDKTNLNSTNKSNTNIPPPIQGPITPYSKRLFKRIHGVSPEKIQISPTSPSNKTLPCEIPKQQLIANNSEEVKLGSSKSKSVTSSKLVIKCDLREPKNPLTSSKSPNSVSIHETIDNIIKNHKAGKYDEKVNANKYRDKDKNSTNTQTNANSNVQNDSEINNTNLSKDENKSDICLENVDEKPTTPSNKPKRLANKPMISPATFGKLVPIDVNKPRTKMSPKPDLKEIKHTKMEGSSQKCRQSSLFSPVKDTSKIQRTKSTANRKSSYLELFGESPIKLDADKSHLKSPPKSPERFVPCSSPILPSSPSLDSDNPEDLIIDTTVCSQKTSPRVSESDQRDENVSKTKVTVFKIPDLEKHQCTEQMPPTPLENAKTSIPTEGNESATIKKTDLHLTKLDNLCNSNKSEELSQNKLEQSFIPENPSEEENPCLPDLSECFSLDNDNQIPIKITPHVKISKSINSDSPQALSECKLPTNNTKETSFEDDFEKCTKNVNDNEETFVELNSENNKSEDIPAAPRFIPSPPQLTLVSAFRHSESSVFNITEDTLGFVSALTRVRDISPIKTPDKHNKITDISNHHSDSINSTKINNEIENSLETSTFVAIKVKKNESHHSVEATVLGSQHSKSSNIIFNCEEKQSKQETASEFNINAHKFEGTETIVNNEIKMPLAPQRNEFKRSRPVRRIVTQTASKVNILAEPDKENINIKASEPSSGDLEDVSKYEMDVTRNKSDNVTPKPNSPKLDNIAKQNGVIKSLQKQMPDKEIKNSKISILDTINKKTAIDSNNIEKDVINIKMIEKNVPINVSSNLEINFSNKLNDSINDSPVDHSKKPFKRSESLKMMPKPIAKINYDTLSKQAEIEKISKNTERKNLNKDTVENKELVQLAHVASFNKRIRVSKYQSKHSSMEEIKSDLLVEHTKNNKRPLPPSNVRESKVPSKSSSVLQNGQVHPRSRARRSVSPDPKDIHERKRSLNSFSPNTSNNRSSEMNTFDPGKDIDSKVSKKMDKFNDALKRSVSKKRLQSESPEPGARSKSYNARKTYSRSHVEKNNTKQPKLSKSKSPEPSDSRKYTPTSKIRRRQSAVYESKPKTHNNSQSRSPVPRNQSNCKLQPEKSHSRSPETFYRNRTPPQKRRRSQSLSPEQHSRAQSSETCRSHRENPASPTGSSRSRSRSRSSYRRSRSKQRRERSRSISPHRRSNSRYRSPYDKRQRSKSHNYRRSRSKSPYFHQKSKWRSRSPVSRPDFYQKNSSSKKYKRGRETENEILHDVTDRKMTVATEQSYSEELEKLRKELESVKSKLKNDLQATKDCSTVNLVSDIQSSPIKKHLKSDVSSNAKVCEKRTIPSNFVLEKSNLIQSENKDVTSSFNKNNSLNDNVSCQIENPTYESSKNCGDPISVNNLHQADKPLKIIKLTRRRTRQLGDSDVNVVSSSSKINGRTLRKV